MRPELKKLTLHRPARGSDNSEPGTLRTTDSQQSKTCIRSRHRKTAPIWCFRSDGEPALVAAPVEDQRRDKEVTCHDQS